MAMTENEKQEWQEASTRYWKNWRAWGSWFSWGSPIGLSVFLWTLVGAIWVLVNLFR